MPERQFNGQCAPSLKMATATLLSPSHMPQRPKYTARLISSSAMGKARPRQTNFVLAGITVLVIGLALRAPIISVSPILVQLQDVYGLSSVAAGLLTSLPVLCFGLLALFAPRLDQRFGMERTISAMLLLIIVGMLIRSFAGVASLFLGTVVLGAAIAVNNVLLPGLVKRDWAHVAGPLMSIQSMSMALGPTLAAVLTVPLYQLLGASVRLALLSWLVLPLAALVLFQALRLQMSRAGGRSLPRRAAVAAGNLLRDRLAWQVTAFLGTQSLLFYSVSAWLPTILVDAGLSATTAGIGFSAFNLAGVAGSLAGPLVAVRLRHQGAVSSVAAGLWVIGLGGLLIAPLPAFYLWVLVAGLGSGVSFSLALTLLVLRSYDAYDAARLSGMVQAVGYAFAATGPLVVGWLFDVSGNWNVPLLFLLALVPLLALAGFGAGRPLLVLSSTRVKATEAVEGP